MNIIHDEIKFIKLQVKVQFTDHGTCHFMFEEVCERNEVEGTSQEEITEAGYLEAHEAYKRKYKTTCSTFLTTLSLSRRNLCQL